MNLTTEQLALPRYLAPDTDPVVTAALDLYEEILPEHNWRTPHNRRALTLYKFSGSVPFVTRRDDAVVALANVDLATQRMKGSAFLEALVVHESVRGENVGRFTIEQIVKAAAEHELETLRARPLESAIGFYAKLGFVCDEIEPVNPAEPFMSLRLA